MDPRVLHSEGKVCGTQHYGRTKLAILSVQYREEKKSGLPRPRTLWRKCFEANCFHRKGEHQYGLLILIVYVDESLMLAWMGPVYSRQQQQQQQQLVPTF